MAAIFGGLVAFFKAIPILNSWLEQFESWYFRTQVASMKKENRDAIKKAIDEQDQRDLEKVLGNPNAGEPSNLPGVEQRNSIPGVH